MLLSLATLWLGFPVLHILSYYIWSTSFPVPLHIKKIWYLVLEVKLETPKVSYCLNSHIWSNCKLHALVKNWLRHKPFFWLVYNPTLQLPPFIWTPLQIADIDWFSEQQCRYEGDDCGLVSDVAVLVWEPQTGSLWCCPYLQASGTRWLWGILAWQLWVLCYL